MSATHQIALMGAIGLKTVTLNDLHSHLPMLNLKQISEDVGRLIRRDYVECLENGGYQLTRCGIVALDSGSPLRSARLRERPVRKARQLGPVILSLQQRAWNAIRLTPARFAIADLVMIAVNDTDKDARSNLANFVTRLANAGYLAELPSRAKSATHPKGAKQWVFVRNTGEKAPSWLRSEKAFRDRNTNETFPAVNVLQVAA